MKKEIIYDINEFPMEEKFPNKRKFSVSSLVLVFFFIITFYIITKKDSNFKISYDFKNSTLTSIFNYLGVWTLLLIPLCVVIIYVFWNLEDYPFLKKVINFANNFNMLIVILGALAAIGSYTAQMPPENIFGLQIGYDLQPIQPTLKEKTYVYFNTLITLIDQYCREGLFDFSRKERIFASLCNLEFIKGSITQLEPLTITEVQALACTNAENLINNVPKEPMDRDYSVNKFPIIVMLPMTAFCVANIITDYSLLPLLFTTIDLLRSLYGT